MPGPTKTDLDPIRAYRNHPFDKNPATANIGHPRGLFLKQTDHQNPEGITSERSELPSDVSPRGKKNSRFPVGWKSLATLEGAK